MNSLVQVVHINATEKIPENLKDYYLVARKFSDLAMDLRTASTALRYI